MIMEDVEFIHEYMVVDMAPELIVGRDIMAQHFKQVNINFAQNTLTIGSQETKILEALPNIGGITYSLMEKEWPKYDSYPNIATEIQLTKTLKETNFTLADAEGDATKVNLGQAKEVYCLEDSRSEPSPDPFPKEIQETLEGHRIRPKRARRRKRPSRVARPETIVEPQPIKVSAEHPLKTQVGMGTLPPAEELGPVPEGELERKNEVEEKKDPRTIPQRKLLDLPSFAAILVICWLLVNSQLVNSTGARWYQPNTRGLPTTQVFQFQITTNAERTSGPKQRGCVKIIPSAIRCMGRHHPETMVVHLKGYPLAAHPCGPGSKDGKATAQRCPQMETVLVQEM
jgi:hypothetical protein